MGYDQPKSLGSKEFGARPRLADLGGLHGARAARRTRSSRCRCPTASRASTASCSIRTARRATALSRASGWMRPVRPKASPMRVGGVGPAGAADARRQSGRAQADHGSVQQAVSPVFTAEKKRAASNCGALFICQGALRDEAPWLRGFFLPFLLRFARAPRRLDRAVRRDGRLVGERERQRDRRADRAACPASPASR